MAEGTNVTLAGDWSKPATALIEKISDAIGGGLKPWQIKRVARAEGEAALIQKKSQIEGEKLLAAAGIEAGEVQLRAVRRMVEGEIRKQVNIENITRLAIGKLEDTAHPERVEQDFVTELFEKAANTSDAEMQQIWAGILAGEANEPGSFSKRALALVSTLDKSDADIFTKFVSCCWSLNGEFVPILTGSVAEIFGKRGIGFDKLTHLDSIGLIRFESVSGFRRHAPHLSAPANFVFQYFGTPICIHIVRGAISLDIGKALLTDAGKQLAAISGAAPDFEIRDAGVRDMMAENREIFTPIEFSKRS